MSVYRNSRKYKISQRSTSWRPVGKEKKCGELSAAERVRSFVGRDMLLTFLLLHIHSICKCKCNQIDMNTCT